MIPFSNGSEYRRNQMKPKTYITITSVLVVLILAVLGLCGYFQWRISHLETRVEDQGRIIAIHEKKIPQMTEYKLLFDGLYERLRETLDAKTISEIAIFIHRTCIENSDIGLTPSLILGVIERESNFDPWAISKAKAYGLMQLIRPTFEQYLTAIGHRSFTPALALRPVENVKAGVYHLIDLRKYWLSEGVEDLIIVCNSYFWGVRYTWDLLLSKKRDRLPSLEYGKGVLDLARKWQERGIA